VRRFRISRGRCRACGRRAQGRHRDQTGDAVGAAASQVGPRAVAIAARLDAEIARLQQQIDALLQRSPTHAPNQKLLKHLANERDHLLTFLTTPGIAATNRRAEQAIRPAVVNRKSWGGNRTAHGAEIQQTLMSVIRTSRRQGACPIAAHRPPAPARTGSKPHAAPARQRGRPPRPVTPARAPRYRVCVYELRDGKTTQVIDAYGSAFITAVATLDADIMDVHFGDGGPRHLQEHIAAAIADEHSTHRPR